MKIAIPGAGSVGQSLGRSFVAAGHQAVLAGHNAAKTAEAATAIGATDPLRSDYSGLTTGDGPSAAEQLGALLPGTLMVKAFNTIMASNQGNPAVHGTTLDALSATDDPGARSTFAALASSIGFRPLYVGPLAAARELEAMAWLIVRLQLITDGSRSSACVMIAPPEAALIA